MIGYVERMNERKSEERLNGQSWCYRAKGKVSFQCNGEPAFLHDTDKISCEAIQNSETKAS